MKIQITDEFIKSLKRLNSRMKLHWRIFDWFRYELPNGIKNIFYFWRTTWSHTQYDYSSSLRLFAKSLELLADSIKSSNEIESSRLKKVARIEELIQIIDRICEDDYIELAEDQLGIEVSTEYLFNDDEPAEVTEQNRIIFDQSSELADQDIVRFCEIIKGQDKSVFEFNHEGLTYEEIENLYFEKFDGTGIKGWWN